MTLFDIIAVVVLGVSVLTGLARGALREVSTVVAFVGAAFFSLFALRFTGPLAAKSVHPVWAANAVAVVLVFIAVYLILRLIGTNLTRSVHNTQVLGTFDRLVGAGFGMVRGLVLLGIFSLLFETATPGDKMPQWVSKSALYPLARVGGQTLKGIAPKGFAAASYLTPALKKVVGAGTQDRSAQSDAPRVQEAPQDAPPIHEPGYSAAARKGLDDVVERNR